MGTAKSTTCIQPVKGLCYSSDIGKTVGTCCDGSFCAPGTGSSDFFCQAVLEEGQDCNPEEFRVFCKTDTFCVDNVCTSKDKTTTTTTTTTSTTSTSTTSTST